MTCSFFVVFSSFYKFLSFVHFVHSLFQYIDFIFIILICYGYLVTVGKAMPNIMIFLLLTRSYHYIVLLFSFTLFLLFVVPIIWEPTNFTFPFGFQIIVWVILFSPSSPRLAMKIFFTDLGLWAGVVIESPCPPVVCFSVTKVGIVDNSQSFGFVMSFFWK